MSEKKVDRRHSNPGRPAGTGQDRVVTERFKVTPEEAIELKRRAAAAGISKSRYIRDRVL